MRYWEDYSDQDVKEYDLIGIEKDMRPIQEDIDKQIEDFYRRYGHNINIIIGKEAVCV